MVAGCGGGGPAAQVAPTESHAPLESLPYAQMGTDKLVFLRNDFQGVSRNGVYRIDPVAGASAFEFNGGTTWYPDDPQVSPDGRSLVETHYTDGNTLFDVYVSNVDGSEQVQASNFPTQEGPASWTPDGSQILFYSRGSDEASNLYRQPPAMLAQTQRVQLTHFTSSASVCPMFDDTSDRVSVSSATGQIVWQCDRQIEVTSADGSTTMTLYTLPAMPPNFTELHGASWSPDGTRIAFMVLLRATDSATGGSGERQQVQINSIDAQGQNETLIATVPSSGLQEPGGENDIYSLCWSLDGSRIFFNVADGNPQAHLWMVMADGTALLQLTNAANVWDQSPSSSH
jgi:Tol biopolymer transport system component